MFTYKKLEFMSITLSSRKVSELCKLKNRVLISPWINKIFQHQENKILPMP